MGGQAVHARRGERRNYLPVSTPLCNSSDITRVIDAYRSVYPFRTFYIADLDALMKNGNNSAIITQVIRLYPGVEFWLDQGMISPRELVGVEWTPVIGSESVDQRTLGTLHDLYTLADCILSLDYSAVGPLGPDILHRTSLYWPRRILLMELAAVGTRTGPNWQRLQTFLDRRPASTLIASGGIRGIADLERLKQLGVSAALVASALHHGKLDSASIQAFMD